MESECNYDRDRGCHSVFCADTGGSVIPYNLDEFWNQRCPADLRADNMWPIRVGSLACQMCEYNRRTTAEAVDCENETFDD